MAGKYLFRFGNIACWRRTRAICRPNCSTLMNNRRTSLSTFENGPFLFCALPAFSALFRRMNGICKTALATLILIGAPAFAGFAGTNSAASGLPAKKMESRQIMRPGYDRFTGMVNAVIIDEGPLVHSAQILPWGRQGEIIGKGDASRQAEQVLENLLLALNAAHVLEGGVVKINFYITRPDTVARMKEAMAHQPNNFNRVAASFVTGNLTDPDALVAADAVAVASFDTDNHAVNRVRAP